MISNDYNLKVRVHFHNLWLLRSNIWKRFDFVEFIFLLIFTHYRYVFLILKLYPDHVPITVCCRFICEHSFMHCEMFFPYIVYLFL